MPESVVKIHYCRDKSNTGLSSANIAASPDFSSAPIQLEIARLAITRHLTIGLRYGNGQVNCRIQNIIISGMRNCDENEAIVQFRGRVGFAFGGVLG